MSFECLVESAAICEICVRSFFTEHGTFIVKIFREPPGSCQGASLGSQVHNFQGALRELPGSQFRELSSLSLGAAGELPGS